MQPFGCLNDRQPFACMSRVMSPPSTPARRFTELVRAPVRTNQNRENLLALTGLVEEGLTPVVGRVYPLADTTEGLRHVERAHAGGKVIIAVS
jgi:NADPH:quinone reductase-like Zn-dependent oxidoreductase